MKRARVLVTGAGSTVGQGIIKSLRLSGLPLTIVGGDIEPLSAGLFRCDEAMQVAKVEDEGAVEFTLQCLEQNKIQVVFIGSEFDLEFYARHRAAIERATGALVIVSPLETVQMSNDKWRTVEFLRRHGFPFPQSYLPETENEACEQANLLGYPLILKGRWGTSSRNVHLIKDRDELIERFASVPHAMLQEQIAVLRGKLSNEFTASVFKCRDGRLLGPFVGRRFLKGGASWIVEVANFAQYHPLLLGIGRVVDMLGSLNVQFMVGLRGALPFEFNARFSGTTAVRAHFGFNEPAMAIRHWWYGESLEAPVIRHGVSLSYLEEVFVDGVKASDLAFDGQCGTKHAWF